MKTFVVGISLPLSLEANTLQSPVLTHSLRIKKPGKINILFTKSQIISILRQLEASPSVRDLVREYGISKVTFCTSKAKYKGMKANELKRLKELEEENIRLKRIIADLTTTKGSARH